MTEQSELFTKPRKHTQLRGEGYAANPGSGPADETCGTCSHLRAMSLARGRRVFKCGVLHTRHWKPNTDIVKHAPACLHWAGESQQSKGQNNG